MKKKNKIRDELLEVVEGIKDAINALHEGESSSHIDEAIGKLNLCKVSLHHIVYPKQEVVVSIDDISRIKGINKYSIGDVIIVK